MYDINNTRNTPNFKKIDMTKNSSTNAKITQGNTKYQMVFNRPTSPLKNQSAIVSKNESKNLINSFQALPIIKNNLKSKNKIDSLAFIEDDSNKLVPNLKSNNLIKSFQRFNTLDNHNFFNNKFKQKSSTNFKHMSFKKQDSIRIESPGMSKKNSQVYNEY